MYVLFKQYVKSKTIIGPGIFISTLTIGTYDCWKAPQSANEPSFGTRDACLVIESHWDEIDSSKTCGIKENGDIVGDENSQSHTPSIFR